MIRTRMTAIAIVLIVGLAGCSSDERREWITLEAADSLADEPVGTIVFQSGSVEIRETREQRDGPCAQVVVAGLAAPCFTTGIGEAGFTAASWRTEDQRFVEIRTSERTREFVVWSTASPGGRSVAPVVAAGNAILVWVMEPGEEPWGVQIINDDGSLVGALPFVGLPAE